MCTFVIYICMYYYYTIVSTFSVNYSLFTSLVRTQQHQPTTMTVTTRKNGRRHQQLRKQQHPYKKIEKQTYICMQVWMYIYTKWVAFIYYLCSKSWKFSRLQNNSNYNNYNNGINNSDAYLEIVKLNDSATVSAAATTTRSRSSTTKIPTPTN